MCDSYETVLGSVWQDTSPSREKQRQELGLLSLYSRPACLFLLPKGRARKRGKGVSGCIGEGRYIHIQDI
jgi:hypothetical protein